MCITLEKGIVSLVQMTHDTMKEGVKGTLGDQLIVNLSAQATLGSHQ